MKKLVTIMTLAIMAFVGTANDSQAISLRFKFKVFSSGPSIYACNAGLRHKSRSSKVCYFEGTTNTCTPNDCTDKTVCNTSCVCTGNDGGDSLMDFMKVEVQDWKDHKATGDNITATGVQQIVKNANYTYGSPGSYSNAIDDNATTWNKRIDQLSFELGSELYGAEYYVDVCYRGPQIEYFANNQGINSLLTAQASETDFLATNPNPGDNSRDGLVIPGTVDGLSYSQLAGLQVKAYYTCDLQGVGTYQYAHNGASASTGTYNTSINEANFNFDGNGYPVSGTDTYGTSGSFQNLAGNGLDLMSAWLAQSSHSPRFCKVRYVFSETNEFGALPFMRKWQRHGAEVCTYTAIEEGLVDNSSSI